MSTLKYTQEELDQKLLSERTALVEEIKEYVRTAPIGVKMSTIPKDIINLITKNK